MAWSMRYTFHAGYAPPDFVPQFDATLGDDPVALVHFAAREGVAGILYPWALDRPADEVARVAAALGETGLAGGCLVIATASPFAWTDVSATGRADLAAAVERACIAATLLNATTLVAFPFADPTRADDAGVANDLVVSLSAAATQAAAYGVRIAVEPMRLPGLILQSLDAALDVVRRAGDVGIVFDTAHVATMHDDLQARFDDAFDDIALLQLADLPGRVEPGAGTLDLVTLAARAIERGYTGLVDFEHGWSALGETGGLARLRDFDARVRAATTGERDVVDAA